MALSYDEESVHKIEQAIIVHTHRYFYSNNVEIAFFLLLFVCVCIFVSMFFYSLSLLLLIYEQFQTNIAIAQTYCATNLNKLLLFSTPIKSGDCDRDYFPQIF